MKKEYEIYVFNLQRSLLRVSCVSICQSALSVVLSNFRQCKITNYSLRLDGFQKGVLQHSPPFSEILCFSPFFSVKGIKKSTRTAKILMLVIYKCTAEPTLLCTRPCVTPF